MLKCSPTVASCRMSETTESRFTGFNISLSSYRPLLASCDAIRAVESASVFYDPHERPHILRPLCIDY